MYSGGNSFQNVVKVTSLIIESLSHKKWLLKCFKKSDMSLSDNRSLNSHLHHLNCVVCSIH
jgi:hypothetical protein